ncbi:MAG: hypothetical protein JWN84_687 [Nocardioides sp.]|nr:hypothetical protein [Nocardioides sp.]
MTPSWYDVLDVDESATADEIRTAWQGSVAGLDPTDRRFKQRNRAAEVLLDPERRAAHDAELAAQAEDEADDLDQTDAPAATAAVSPAGADRLAKPAARRTTTTSKERGGTATVATDEPPSRRRALTAALAVLALVLVVLTAISLAAGGGSGAAASADEAGLPDAREVQAARKAAEVAIVPVVSYDYRDLDQSQAAATSFMTPAYADVYDKNFSAIVSENAATTKTIVTAEVVSSGVVRTGESRVDVLVFLNRPTRNASGDKVSRDQVTVQMLDVDGTWLVDCLVTAPGDTCGD